MLAVVWQLTVSSGTWRGSQGGSVLSGALVRSPGSLIIKRIKIAAGIVLEVYWRNFEARGRITEYGVVILL